MFLGDEVPPAVFAEIGEAMLKLKDYKGAERAFARARLATDFAAMERRVASAYEDAGLIEDAERVWRRVLRRDPDNPVPMLKVAALAERRGAGAEALELYTTAATTLLASEGVPEMENESRPRRGGGGAAAAGIVAGGGRVMSVSRGAAMPIALVSSASAGSTRNKTNDGPSSSDAIAGALRSATDPAQLEPLRVRVRELLAEPERRPLERLALIERLRQLLAPADHPETLAELRQHEAAVLGDGKPSQRVVSQVLAWRLADGDLAGAAEVVARMPNEGFNRDAFEVELLLGHVDRATQLTETASVRDLGDALRTLHLLGHTDAAEAVLQHLEREARQNPQTGATWVACAHLLGKTVDDSFIQSHRLEQALAVTDPTRRLAGVVGALRTQKDLPAERKQEVLRQLLPDALQDKTGNLATMFLEAARGTLTQSELQPLVEKTLRTCRARTCWRRGSATSTWPRSQHKRRC